MDDTKYYTMQIKGTAYRFKPFPPEDLEKVALIATLNVTPGKSLKLLSKLLSESAGPEQWDKITDLYISGQLSLEDMTVRLFERLVKRAVADKEAGAEPQHTLAADGQ